MNKIQAKVNGMNTVTWGFMKGHLKDLPDDTVMVVLDQKKMEVLTITGAGMGVGLMGADPKSIDMNKLLDPNLANASICFIIAEVMEQIVVEHETEGDA